MSEGIYTADRDGLGDVLVGKMGIREINEVGVAKVGGSKRL